MQRAYPGNTINANREQGIWPVPSLSSEGYRTIMGDVRSAIPSVTESTQSRIRIFDIGASFGDPLAGFAKDLRTRLGRSIETVALDVNPHAVYGVRRRGNADVALQGMAQQVPLTAESVDIVIAKQFLAFLHPDDQSQSLREVERVLAPKGVAVVEVDPTGSHSMTASRLWVLSAPTLRHLRCATDDFNTYPFPSPSEEMVEDEP